MSLSGLTRVRTTADLTIDIRHRRAVNEMPKDRRYNVHFLVAKDGNQYSALCYEFTTAGCGKTIRSALQEAILSTLEYLDHLIREGREQDAPRPAPTELVLEFVDLPVTDEVTREQLEEALSRVLVAPVCLERPALVRYDLENRELVSSDLPRLPASDVPGPLGSYPAELVLAGGS